MATNFKNLAESFTTVTNQLDQNFRDDMSTAVSTIDDEHNGAMDGTTDSKDSEVSSLTNLENEESKVNLITALFNNDVSDLDSRITGYNTGDGLSLQAAAATLAEDVSRSQEKFEVSNTTFNDFNTEYQNGLGTVDSFNDGWSISFEGEGAK